MKKIIRFSWINALVGVVLCTILFSFSSITGAHSVQVYLDDKLMIDHYVDTRADAPTLRVNPTENHRDVIVKYSECGRTVTGRTITIKDDNNKVLKDWKFEGAAAGFEKPMACSMKDIAALQSKGGSALKLYYSSNEFPEGQQIAKLIIESDPKTALK
ncbi:hypothetical protein [Chryseolinea sp. H1M3-3]|uniref:hypothetical protein n=1 Tax=Chryseolinea sp. H1M3-3 TaxID=3034144 RepID=UPI0023ED17B1|nr:hypothetical protein [Chryseolinea sp. H1M3-3]